VVYVHTGGKSVSIWVQQARDQEFAEYTEISRADTPCMSLAARQEGLVHVYNCSRRGLHAVAEPPVWRALAAATPSRRQTSSPPVIPAGLLAAAQLHCAITEGLNLETNC
jgi:hypothetical protein